MLAFLADTRVRVGEFVALNVDFKTSTAAVVGKFGRRASFFCQPSGNSAQCGLVFSLLPLQFPFHLLALLGGCAAAGDDVTTNAAGKAADWASATLQSFFFMNALLL
jgi:hypothetical protein